MEERIIRLSVPYMRGEDVLRLQRALMACGYPCGGGDGIFGPKTRAATARFQSAAGLSADGVAGPKTLSALWAAERALQTQEPGDLKSRFIAWLNQQVGHIYVWGGQGHRVPDEAWIQRVETNDTNARRAIRLYQKRKREGRDPILAYDCSGLLMCFFLAQGVFKTDMTARGIHKKCRPLERSALLPGDLVFRHNNIRVIHVGVYVGNGMVIEAKGRDAGVVLRDIDASGGGYWNLYGRLMELWR